MLKCREIALQGSDYIDNALNWKQSISFRLHLMVCNNCRRFINHLKTALVYLRNIKYQGQASVDLTKILARVNKSKPDE